MATDDRAGRLTRPDEGVDRSNGTVLLAGAIAAIVVSPVVWLVLQAVGQGPARILGLLVGGSTLRITVNSVLLTGLTTLGSVAIGVPLAVLTVQTDLPFRRFWTVVCALPLVVPSYIGAFAFVSAFGPRGLLTEFVPTGATVYGLGGTVLVLTLFVYPYVFLTTRAALLSFDTTLLEAARTLDHSYLAAFRRVALPRILPGVTAGALLVALYALSDFGTPAIMHYDVFTRLIYVYYATPGSEGAAVVLSLQLLVITGFVLALESRIGAASEEKGYASSGRSDAATIELGWWKLPATLFPASIAVLCLVVPVGVLTLWILRGGPGYTAGGFAFEWSYGINTVVVSLVAALATTLVAIPIALSSARTETALSRLTERATYFGYATPGVVLGLALVVFGSNYAPALYQTLPLLVFAYVVRFLPQAVGTTRSSVLQVDETLVEAARTLGVSQLAAFRRVTLPLIAPGVIAGAALVFLTSMRELPATLLLHPTGFTTLVTYVWRVTDAGYYGAAAVPALALIGVSGLSMLVILSQEGDDGG